MRGDPGRRSSKAGALPFLALALLLPSAAGAPPGSLHCPFGAGGSPGSANVLPWLDVELPPEGSVLRGVTTARGTAHDPDDGELCSVEGRVDDAPWLKLSGLASWSVQLDTHEFPNGVHRLEFRAFDHVEASPVVSRTVTFDNGPWTDLALYPVDVSASGVGTMVLEARVRNLGNATAGGFNVGFSYVRGDGSWPLGEARVDGVPPGGVTSARLAWTPLGKWGTFRIRAHADPEGNVVDARPWNNVATGSVRVLFHGSGFDPVPG